MQTILMSAVRLRGVLNRPLLDTESHWLCSIDTSGREVAVLQGLDLDKMAFPSLSPLLLDKRTQFQLHFVIRFDV